ncbi:MAG: sugar phosphate nucleotidyltransferase [Patescibacteria group bacterium]|jgi:glucose-1-phosphate thymidylyltransferase
MKGIILAGGAGSRLQPLTKVTSKQLLPVYDKPMIYYPLETLIEGGIKDILIISDPSNIGNFVRLLGSGKDFGVKISYEVQDKPEGIAQAFIIGENFISDDNVTLILGDNLFVGDGEFLDQAIKSFSSGGRVFAKQVPDPNRFGVVEFDKQGKVVSIEEKPDQPKSNFAVTGLYIYDNSVIDKAKNLKPSARGEVEVTDINNLYLKEGTLDVKTYEHYWLDTGTFDTLLEAGNTIAKLRRK